MFSISTLSPTKNGCLIWILDFRLFCMFCLKKTASDLLPGEAGFWSQCKKDLLHISGNPLLLISGLILISGQITASQIHYPPGYKKAGLSGHISGASRLFFFLYISFSISLLSESPPFVLEHLPQPTTNYTVT